MNKVWRWSLFFVGLIFLLGVYGFWKELDKQTGGSHWISAMLRGAVCFGGLVLLYNWAKDERKNVNKPTEIKSTPPHIASSQAPIQRKTKPSEIALGKNPQFTPYVAPRPESDSTNYQPSGQSNLSTPALSHNVAASQSKLKATSSVNQPSVVVKPMLVNSDTHVPSPNIDSLNTMEPSMENLEDWVYEKVGEELESNTPDKAVWTKSFAQSGGDDKQTRVLYIKLRVEKLIALETARIESERKAQQAAELVRLENERKELEQQQLLARMNKLEKVLYGKSIEDINRLEISQEGKDFLNACSWGFVHPVTVAIEKNPLFLAITSNNGNTGLHWAVVANHWNIVSILAEHGASPSIPNNDNETPISIARSKGLTMIVEILEHPSGA